MTETASAWQIADVMLTGLQALFAFVGTIGLIISLWFTKKALDLSRQAIEDQARYTRSELAAYMSRVHIKRIINDDLQLEVQFRNVGQTPAVRVRGDIGAGVGPREFGPVKLVLNTALSISDVAPEQIIDLRAGPTLTLEQVDDLVSETGVTAMYVYGWLAWDDVFEHRRAVPFCAAMYGPSLAYTEEIVDFDPDLMPEEERRFAPEPRPSNRTGRFRAPS